MSFQFNWDAIRSTECLADLQEYLNDRVGQFLAGKKLPVDKLRFEQIVFDEEPPEIIVQEIGHLEPPFCFSPPSFSPGGETTEEAATVKSASGNASSSSGLEDIQVTLLINYDSNLSIRISGELVVNQPSPKFLSLPISFTIRRIRLQNVHLIIAHRGDGKNSASSSFIAIRREADTIIDYELDSEIGDASKHGK